MKRIAVLGNSHVASLKQGWERLSNKFPEIELEWFASKRDGLRDLRAEGTCLVAGTDCLRQDLEFTSGGQSVIECTRYDVFIVVGSEFPMPHLRKELSLAVRAATCSDIYSKSTNCWLVKLVRQICPNSVIVVTHNPLKAMSAEPAPYATQFLNYPETLPLVTQIVEAHGGLLFAQPSVTMSGTWSTQGKYTVGSVALGAGSKRWFAHAREEISHMNADYGEIALNALLETLGIQGVETDRD